MREHGRNAIWVASGSAAGRGDEGRRDRREDLTREVDDPEPLGLHARAAAKFVHMRRGFSSQIRVARGTREMDGKSIMGILLLAAAHGTIITSRADGADEDRRSTALCALVERGFGEDP